MNPATADSLARHAALADTLHMMAQQTIESRANFEAAGEKTLAQVCQGLTHYCITLQQHVLKEAERLHAASLRHAKPVQADELEHETREPTQPPQPETEPG